MNAIKINDDFKVEGSTRKSMIIKRPDGFKVFINKDDPEILNNIKLYYKDKKLVMMATGIFNGMKIADNYNKKYGKEDIKFVEKFEKVMNKLSIKRLT